MSAGSRRRFSLPQISWKGRRKGKAGAMEKPGEAGKARLPSGMTEDGSVAKQAANLLLSRARRACVCLSRHNALQIPSCLQPCRSLASGDLRMVSFWTSYLLTLATGMIEQRESVSFFASDVPPRLYPNKATNVWSFSWQRGCVLITPLPAILPGAGLLEDCSLPHPLMLLMRVILRLHGANHNMLPTVREQDTGCSSQELSSIILIDETKSEQKK